jgi:hypothetical protein
MMTDLIAKLGVAMVTKLITETFLSKILVYTLRAWAKQTVNDWDNKVVDAISEAFNVAPDTFGGK